MVRRYLWPAIAGAAVWLTGSVITSYEFSRRVRFTGPGHESVTPFLDSMTQTLQAWLAPGFFTFVAVFVFERWLEDRRTARSQSDY
jgi:hypothetical protein